METGGLRAVARLVQHAGYSTGTVKGVPRVVMSGMPGYAMSVMPGYAMSVMPGYAMSVMPGSVRQSWLSTPAMAQYASHGLDTPVMASSDP